MIKNCKNLPALSAGGIDSWAHERLMWTRHPILYETEAQSEKKC